MGPQVISKKQVSIVTGATGSLGPELVRQLASTGYAVRIIARHAPDPGVYPKDCEYWMGDILDREFLEKAVAGARIVFHLAAKLHVRNPGPELRREYWRVNVEGTRNVVQASAAAGVQRLVYFSTINVYGPTQGSLVDENALPSPQDDYAVTKHAAEEIVLQARDKCSGLATGVVLRLAAIYGPRMKGNYPRLIRALTRGHFIPIGSGTNRRTLVYKEDAVRAALLAAQSPKSPGCIYNVSDGKVHRLRDILAAISSALGRPEPRWYLPTGPIRRLAAAADSLSFLTRHPLHLTNTIDKFVEDIAVRADRIQAELGFQPLVNLQEGWKKTLAAEASALRHQAS
jgi:nucleoside-diphosphate-sugar epimerase